ncbi:MFS transporter [Paraburkholderia sediminicola]|uniref:MFS transporter n=1 Tax=Paraburkholderia rhynchosiae TaxID=487049 RepID=A0ACC7N3W6_9BURK
MWDQHKMRTIQSLFKVRGYASFFASRLFNSIAIWVDFTLIFSLLSFSYNAAPRTLGIAAALYGLPGLLLGPFIGVLADRNSPALVMLASSTGRFISSLLLAIAPNEGFFIAMVLLKGISNLGSVPAEQILVRRLLTDEQIVSTTTLTSLIDQCTKIASPLLGAALAVVSHSRGGFFFTAVLAFASAGCAVRIGAVIGWKSADHQAKNRLPNFSVLWQTILSKPRFAVALTLMLALSLTLGLYDSILVLLLREHGLPASAFGTIVSCTAAGAISCALVLKRVLVRTSEFRVMLASLCGFSVTVIAAGVLGIAYERLSLPVLCVLWLINGFCYAGGVMAYSISLQTESPREMLGVLSSTGRSLQLCALVGGPIVGSWIAQHFGTPWTFIGAGAVGLCIACAGAGVLPSRIPQPG